MTPDRLNRHDHPRDEHHVTWGDLRELAASYVGRYEQALEELADRHRRAIHVIVSIGVFLLVFGIALTAAGAIIANSLKANTGATEQAICAIASYADDQAQNITIRQFDVPLRQRANLRQSASELSKLAAKMRSTGINCPPD